MSKLKSKPSLFVLDDFRPYLKSWINACGRGESLRISKALGIHTTLVSQILNGHKCFTEEQAALMCEYMKLNVLETDYFMNLVQLERAGNDSLKSIFKRQLFEIRKHSDEVISRVPESKSLTEQDRATFYSSWQYSVVRLLTSIDGIQSVESISRHLNLSVSRVQEILDFLTTRRLCKIVKGKYVRTEKNTHVEAQSSLSVRHHQNWRSRALTLLENMTQDELTFTAPLTISAKDASAVRKILLDTISKISKIVEKSPPEQVIYLGIDWLKT